MESTPTDLTHQHYPVNFAGMGEDEDPDAYDRIRDGELERYGIGRRDEDDFFAGYRF